MGIFGRPGADDILERGTAQAGQLTGIELVYISTEDGHRLEYRYAVDVGDRRLGIRQRLAPDDLVRLGMTLVVVVHKDAGVIDWAATGRTNGFDGVTETMGHQALKDAPAPGIVDPGLDRIRKKGEPATLTITSLDERSYLGGLARRLDATVTVAIDGTDPYQAEVKGIEPPGFASHLVAVGRSIGGYVALRRLDKPQFDWAAAAMAEPGVGVAPTRPREDRPAESAASTSAPIDVAAEVAATANDAPTFGGIDLATYVAVEVGLQRDRVRPDAYDTYAAAKGVPAGTWATASAAWQAAISADWRLGAAFGEAFEAERRRR